jgi:hypothetical protein
MAEVLYWAYEMRIFLACSLGIHQPSGFDVGFGQSKDFSYFPLLLQTQVTANCRSSLLRSLQCISFPHFLLQDDVLGCFGLSSLCGNAPHSLTTPGHPNFSYV